MRTCYCLVQSYDPTFFPNILPPTLFPQSRPSGSRREELHDCKVVRLVRSFAQTTSYIALLLRNHTDHLDLGALGKVYMTRSRSSSSGE